MEVNGPHERAPLRWIGWDPQTFGLLKEEENSSWPYRNANSGPSKP